MTDRAEQIVLEILESDRTTTVYEVAKVFALFSADPERLAREICWKLVEHGRARFDSDWYLVHQ